MLSLLQLWLSAPPVADSGTRPWGPPPQVPKVTLQPSSKSLK